MKSSMKGLTLIACTGIAYVLSVPTILNATIHTVTVNNFSFSPSTTTVSYGDTVRWIQQTGLHTTTSDLASAKDWDSNNLQNSVPFDAQFNESDGAGPFPYHCKNHASMHGTVVVQTMDVELSEVDALPSGFSLGQNYPNPFNPSTEIKFSLDRSAVAQFEVYNILGEQVELRDFGMLSPGTYSITWDARSSAKTLPSGVYLYRLLAGELVETRKMVLLK